MPRNNYTRKISSEEASEGYVLVEKSRLGFFPQVGLPFPVEAEGGRSLRSVEARPCTCRGPGFPHEHYFIRYPGLHKGERVTITAPATTGAAFTLARDGSGI